MVGGALWLKGGVSEKRVGCFAVSLMTVVSVCGGGGGVLCECVRDVCVGGWVCAVK